MIGLATAGLVTQPDGVMIGHLSARAAMRITILTYGTRGDVQPYAALGVGLEQAGHRVRLAAPLRFEQLVTDAGLEFGPLAGDPVGLAEHLADRAGTSSVGAIRAMWAHVLPLAEQVSADVRVACRDADLIVHSFLMTLSGHIQARERGVPDISALIFPVFVPTGSFASPAFRWRFRGSGPLLPHLNRFTHLAFNWVFWHGGRAGYGWLRKRTGAVLPPLGHWPFAEHTGSSMPVLFGFSPTVIPKPEDWPAHVHVTGYWFLKHTERWQPPEDLTTFLEAGPKPVCIGFGSMGIRQRGWLWRTVLDALDRAGHRAVVLSGWGELAPERTPAAVIAIDAVPHQWLFPRMTVVVHHGGAGTTAAALRAGVPSVVVPFTADQPFWGSRVHSLGVGPAPISRGELTAQSLADAITTAIEDRGMRTRAEELGARIRAENGVGRAVALINASCAPPRRS